MQAEVSTAQLLVLPQRSSVRLPLRFLDGVAAGHPIIPPNNGKAIESSENFPSEVARFWREEQKTRRNDARLAVVGLAHLEHLNLNGQAVKVESAIGKK
ncbi:hypothetical protein DdX_10764 [Ditylenchus destructor]|uniref:Uncharacterized protein n=1 Tax=Ditylenchus destructor TaxID=166010 RepID=A0AAD4R577_9BILA|nr:hypothetical protein DdX_10764 [Ditylenchus destructor]